MKSEWTTITSKRYVSEYGVIWHEKDEDCWYSKLAFSKMSFGGFKTKKEAQLFLEHTGKLENQYREYTLNHSTKLEELVSKLKLDKDKYIWRC